MMDTPMRAWLRQPSKTTVMVAFLVLTAEPSRSDENNWHLLTQSYGGTVSLHHKLDKQACEFIRARALGLPATPEEVKAERERYAAANPTCPTDASKDGWAKWQKANPHAEGCRHGDGNGATSWAASRMISAGDIKSAECFQ